MNIKVVVPDSKKLGEYSDGAAIQHDDFTGMYTLDLLRMVQVGPQDAEAYVVSRVVMSPSSLRNLIAALSENLSRVEAKAGAEKIPVIRGLEIRDESGRLKS